MNISPHTLPNGKNSLPWCKYGNSRILFHWKSRSIRRFFHWIPYSHDQKRKKVRESFFKCISSEKDFQVVSLLPNFSYIFQLSSLHTHNLTLFPCFSIWAAKVRFFYIIFLYFFQSELIMLKNRIKTFLFWISKRPRKEKNLFLFVKIPSK